MSIDLSTFDIADHELQSRFMPDMREPPGETLNKSAFYGEPAQPCDAGINKIKGLAPLNLPQKFLHLFNQRFPRTRSCHASVVFLLSEETRFSWKAKS